MKKAIDLFYGYDNTTYGKELAEKFKEAFKHTKTTTVGVNSFVGFHIEAGNSNFTDFSNAAIHDLGSEVIPFLKDWYLNYIRKGKYFNKSVERNEEEINRVHNFFLNTYNDDKQLFEHVQRNSKDHKIGVHGKLPDVDQPGRSTDENGRETEKGANNNSTRSERSGKSEGDSRNLDADNSSIYRAQGNKDSNKQKQGLSERHNATGNNEELHRLSAGENKNSDPGGDYNNGNDNSEDKGKLNKIQESLKTDLENVFDVTDTISVNAKVLRKYYNILEKNKVISFIEGLGYDVSAKREGIQIIRQPIRKKQHLTEYKSPENKIFLYSKYSNYKELFESKDFSIIEYNNKYAIVYANSEIEATTNDLKIAQEYMHQKQKEFDAEINDIKSNRDLFGEIIHEENESKYLWGKIYKRKGGAGNKDIVNAIRKDIKEYAVNLANTLGYEHYTNQKGKKEYCDVNIAPAGGNASIVLWKPNSNYGIYISIGYQPDYTYSAGYDNYKPETNVLWRITSKDNVWRGKENRYVRINEIENMNGIFIKEINRHIEPYIKTEKKKINTQLVATEYFTQKHSKNNKILYTVSIKKEYRLKDENFKDLLKEVKKNKGYYSSYTKDGMRAGFIFKNENDALEFQKTIEPIIQSIFHTDNEEHGKVTQFSIDKKNEQEIERIQELININYKNLEEDFREDIITDNEPIDEEERERFTQIKSAQDYYKSEIEPIDNLIKAVKERIDKGEKVKNTPELRKIAEQSGMITGIDYKDVKDLYDIASNALNLYILENPNAYKVTRNDSNEKVISVIEKLEKLQQLLPTETERSYKMVALQQFSTPLSMSLIANMICEVDENDVMLEPSAGEGNLAVFSKIAGAKVIANEIDPLRETLLKKIKVDQVLSEDGKHIHAILKDEVSAVVMNPPFSKDIKQGNKKEVQTGRIHVESAIKKLKEKGRLVAVVGRGMSMNAPANKNWWTEIKKEYNVLANILVSGDAYRKKGTSFDNRLIVIDKDGPTKKTIEKEVSNYTELFEALKELPNKKKNILNNESSRRIKENNWGENSTFISGKSFDSGNANSNIRGITNSKTEGQSTTRDGQLDLYPQSETNGVHDRTHGENNTDKNKKDNKRPGKQNRNSNNGVPGNGSNVRNSSGEQRYIPKYDIGKLNIKYSKKKIDAQNNIGYDNYIPEIIVEGSKPHPAKLVESTAMSSVNLPPVEHIPNISKSIVESGALSDAQLEDIILAGAATKDKLTNGETKGFFLGGGTGYGKGRTLAAIILDEMNRKGSTKKALWLSKNENAHYDSSKYWAAVGGDKKLLIKNVKANIKIEREEGLLLATYGMLSNKFVPKENESDGYWSKEPDSRLQQIAQWLGKDFDGVIVFDEAHMMGNAIDTKGERGTKKASLRALVGIEIQNLLPNAKIVYSSATGATEVMNLAYAKRLGLWGDGTAFSDVHEFINAIDGSGVAGMELVSRDLKAMGLYTSKSLSFDGVKYETLQHDLTENQVELYNKVARAWQLVLQNINEAIEANNTSSNKQMHVMSSFWGAHQRFFQQVITTMQMPTLLNDIDNEIENGRAPIIQLVSTNEAATQRELAEKKAESGGKGIDYESLELSPKNILLEYIRKGFPTQLYEKTVDGNGNEIKIAVKDASGKPVENPDSVRRRDKLIADIDSQINLPESPLDIIINHIGPENIAEVTGRSNRIVLRENEEGQLRKVEERRTKSDVSKDKDDFMDGRKNVLIFSEAGGTGSSFHSDKTRINKKQRVHYVLQAGWRADAAVQGFGRSHRSNQEIEPIFKLVTTNLKAQRRFLSSIARRLDQLGALTKGQRQTGGQGILDGTFNLEGGYAKQALFEFYQNVEKGNVPMVSMFTLETEMALKIYKQDQDGVRQYNDNVIFNTKMFLNRIMSLEVEVMNRVFESYMLHIQDQIESAKKRGVYDEGIEIVKALKTEVINEDVIYQDKKTGAKTYLTDIELEIANNRKTFDDIRERMESYGDRFQGYFREKTSGKIYGIVKNEYGTIHGTLDTVIRRFSIVNDSIIEDFDFKNKYEELEIKDAQYLWDNEYSAYPETRKKLETIVKGTILPIWGNLPESINVRRYIDSNGTPHLGRFYNKKDVNKIRQKFNAISNVSFDLKEVLEVLQNGGKAELGNNFLFVRKKHQGINEIAIENVRAFKERNRLEKAGATFKMKNSIGAAGEFFISFHNAEVVISEVLKLYGTSIVNAEDKDGNQLRGKSKEVLTEIKKEKDAKDLGYRKHSESSKNLFDNIGKVIDLDILSYWKNYSSGEYGDAIMKLNVEKQELYDNEILNGYNDKGAYKLVISQNYIQNGDMMNDPRIDVAMFPGIGVAYPLNYEQHGPHGRYEEYVADKKHVLGNMERFKDTERFMNKTWLPNLLAQDRVIQLKKEIHQLSMKDLLTEVKKGNIDFNYTHDGKTFKIKDFVMASKILVEKSKIETTNKIIERVTEFYHQKKIDEAISKNLYVPGKALRNYKKYNTAFSLYKHPNNMSPDEYTKAEVICIDDKEIRAEERSDNVVIFKVDGKEYERTLTGYNEICGGVDVKVEYVNKWKLAFEKRKFKELANDKILMNGDKNHYYVKSFEKYLGVTNLPYGLDNGQKRQEFIEILIGIHEKKFGKMQPTIFDDEPAKSREINEIIEGNMKKEKNTLKLNHKKI